jgi:hypothetical protein
VAVQGADPDPGAAGDVLQGGGLAVFGEGLPTGGQELVVVLARIGPLGPWSLLGGDIDAGHGRFYSSSCKTEDTSV